MGRGIKIKMEKQKGKCLKIKSIKTIEKTIWTKVKEWIAIRKSKIARRAEYHPRRHWSISSTGRSKPYPLQQKEMPQQLLKMVGLKAKEVAW